MTGPNDQSESESDATDSIPQEDNKSKTVTSSETEPAELTPEEQMALYEESLKDTDWGHQPC